MRLLKLNSESEISLTEDLSEDVPPYAILSHTWGSDKDEVTFADLNDQAAGYGQSKAGYAKIRFCGDQARKDGIEYFWVDTCCINKNNHVELSEAITSMFRWYREAVKCYVYLPDVSSDQDVDNRSNHEWEPAFRVSRWFTRGWTLQELLAPERVEFFSREAKLLGDKTTLVHQIHEITKIPTSAVLGRPLSQFSTEERMRWTVGRNTKKVEDKAYCLLGIFDVFMPLIYGERDHSWARLEEEIAKRSAPPVRRSQTNTHWIVSRPTNPLFTGREKLLQELEGTIRDAINRSTNRTQCRVVISGMGGQGKSEICLQLTRRLRNLFWLVLWVDISTKDMAERSFIEAARKISIPAQDWEDACLGIANLKYPWLLVLDNADDPDIDYQNYFPDSDIGVVLMTTRNDECWGYGTDGTIALDGLDENDARELLLKAARIPPSQYAACEQDATEVASLLQSHPLALNQAGAYVSRGQCTLAAYPALYALQRQRLLTYRPKQVRSRYCDVYATFEVSAEMLKNSNTEAGQDALQLLSLLAMCDSSRFPLFTFELASKHGNTIPIDMEEYAEDATLSTLTPWHVAHLPPFCYATGKTWNSLRLMEAVALLKAYSLITIDTVENLEYVSTHALVHAWARDRQDQDMQLQSWVEMGCIMALAVRRRKLFGKQEQLLLRHVQALTELDVLSLFTGQDQELVVRVLMGCGWFLCDAEAHRELFVLTDLIFTSLGLDRTKPEPSWFGLYNLRALTLVSSSKAEEGLSLLENVVVGQEQSSGEGPDLLSLYHNLARAYCDSGRAEQAVWLLERVRSMEEQMYSKHDQPRLFSGHELARSYLQLGRFKEAIPLLEEVVKAEAYTLDEHDPEGLKSQHALAGAYRADGRLQEAIALLEKVVYLRAQVLSEHHPDRLAAQHNLALLLWESGQREAGLARITKVVEVQRHCLGKGDGHRTKSERALIGMQEEMALSGVENETARLEID